MKNRTVRFAILLAFPLVVSCSARDILMGSDGPSGVDAKPVKLSIEPTALTVGFNESAYVVVRVLHLDNSPAANREVAFSIDGIPGGSFMMSDRMLSGDDGYITNELVTGADKTNFRIVAAALTAESVSADVKVDGVYDGDLRVVFQYNGLISLQQITTRLHDGAFNCAGIDFAQPPPSITSQIAAGPSTQLVFGGLPEREVYSITASAIGPAGDEVAVGCATAPAIVGRSSVTVTVSLGLFPENFEGVYDFGLEMHTDQALPGAAGQAVDDLNAFFFDPANVLADELLALMAAQTGMDPATLEGTLTAAWIFWAITEGFDPDQDGDGEFIDDVITFYLLDRAPAWFYDGLTIGGDMTELMKNLTIGGKLEITNVDAAGALQGHWDWSEFLFLWRYNQGCDLADTCCGRHRYSGAEVGLAPMGADITGTVVKRSITSAIEYDMTIDEHQMTIQFGNVILFGLNQFVLPSLTGESNIAGAIESLFGCIDAPNPSDPQICGCDRVGVWLDDAVGTNGIGAMVCNLAVVAISDRLESTILNLSLSGTDDEYFLMSANTVIADSDLDLTMDAITGTTLGSLFIQGNKADFTGDMVGDRERTACTADGSCSGGQACGVKLDVLDDCAGRQVCVAADGDRVAGNSCTLGTQCQSGVCLGGQTGCFSACADDLDCPGALGCGLDAATVQVTTEITMQVNACGM